MGKTIGQFIIWLLGWKVRLDIPAEVLKKCVLTAAPHTSNWDFPIAIAAMSALGVKIRYTIKRQWMQPPHGWLFKWLGGIGVNRTPEEKGDKPISLVDAIVKLYDQHEELCVIIQPEGTRSLQTKWKTGFYHIARQAQVPIALGYLNFKTKTGGVGKVIYPSGDLEKDLHEIMEFYKNIPGKFPENFALDERYYPAENKGN